jgi:hypothetical protein
MVSAELLAQSRAAFIDAFGFGRKTRCTENDCDNFRYEALSGMPAILPEPICNFPTSQQPDF